MPKEDPVREIGKAALALGSLVLCIIIIVFVSWPLFNWLLDLARQWGWVGETMGVLVMMFIFVAALVPTVLAYYLLDNWFRKLVGESDNSTSS